MINRILVKYLSNFSAESRKLITVFLDASLIILSNEFVLWINPIIHNDNYLNFLNKSLLVLVALFIYISTGQYRSLSRYIGSKNIYIIAARNFFTILFLFLINFIFFNGFFGYKYYILLFFVTTIFTGSSKFILRDILLSGSISNLKKNNKVIIYGAGKLGAQLASILLMEGYILEAFVDDNKNKWNRSLFGIKIISFSQLEKTSTNVNQIYIAIPNLLNSKKRIIYNYCLKNKIKVLDINSFKELTNINIKKEDFKVIEIEKILGRDVVKPFEEFLGPGIKNKVIFITGAGGSIGSEMCRQCIEKMPRKLIMLDKSEANLFHIHDEILEKIEQKSLKNIDLIPLLNDAIDQDFLEKTFIKEKVEIVFHAAAYKHVPLVEINSFQGIKNNFLSVRSVCKAAVAANIKQALFISSDKAVRPTNIMGATKRLSEIIVKSFSQDYYDKKNCTIFSSVRFGNVLGSSGSVVPKFKKQIENGGPLTITHNDVVRYFMTIEEASQLVLQAAFLAKGGETFLLDMGKPVKIIDLARQMIFLNGLTVKDKNNMNGDIEIKNIGLRPGEKLYEELLISGKSIPTAHPLIYLEKDEIDSEKLLFLNKKIEELEYFIEQKNELKTLDLLSEIVPEWERKS